MNDNPNAASEPAVVLVGTGRLAQSILRTMPRRVVAAVARTEDSAGPLRAIKPDLRVVRDVAELDRASYDLLWIVTADAAIEAVAASVAAARDDWRGVVAVHSSGAMSPRALDSLARLGARTFALHPNDSFTGGAAIARDLLWSISSGDPASLSIAAGLLEPVAPRIVVIDEAMRPLYHAAASVAANYSVTLFAVAVDLYRRAGLSEPEARGVTAAFIEGSAARARDLGPPGALTGPIARGDADVLGRQRAAVAEHAPGYLDLFNALARATSELAASRAGSAPQEDGQGES